jgi:cytochrome c oxidase subunit 2
MKPRAHEGFPPQTAARVFLPPAVRVKRGALPAVKIILSQFARKFTCYSWISPALLFLCSGCDGNQSALNPAGTQAGQINTLWWLFFGITTAVYFVVLVFLVGSIARFRPRGQDQNANVIFPEAADNRRLGTRVGTAVGLTVVLLAVLLMAEVFSATSLHQLSSEDALSIKITGHQWWWEVQYDSATPANTVSTANEIHIPTGKPIQFKLSSTDVIHSFWVPNLHGKKDLIPGHPTTLWLRADRAGTYYGQCAEFCGLQHAHMRLAVVVEEASRFQVWLEAQRQSAPEPKSEQEKKGQHVFLTSTCVMCHTISGTIAGARLGPTLTHIASRQFIGAGRIKNTRDDLRRWIQDAHQFKPGVRMPQNPLPSEDFQSLIDYLESLK